MAEVIHIENPALDSLSMTPPKEEKRNFFQRAILRLRAKRQARKIMKSLGEARQIQGGRKKGKSYDEFLQEL